MTTPAAAAAPRTGPPDRLTISLWDFTWYTRTGPGEPFEDLDQAFAQAVARGYDTVRVCAMPYLPFGSGLDTTALRFTPFGGGYGMATRWYDVTQGSVVDGRAHLLALFQAARGHDCHIIVSSWEYRQSSAFLDEMIDTFALRDHARPFSADDVGRAICLAAVGHAARVGAWGTVVCSNAAPHHPMWDDLDLQITANAAFQKGTTR
ncbi:cellulase-like family protein [Streptosporangium sp. NPDC048865]|uniref:cellulase-like family protein n=1 Tax=Streptosporangium sp. NPDC048865 TaxID=3155766 RepID=UPI003424A31B